MRKLPYSMELNASGEIWSFAQEEETPGSIDWQLQQVAKAQKMVRIDLIGIFAISSQNVCKIQFGERRDGRKRCDRFVFCDSVEIVKI
jgi:hypothetical protein